MAVPPDKVIANALKSGFESELKVASILSGSGWVVDQSVYYIDRDEQIGRELDILSYRILDDTGEKPEVTCGINLCMEVKKTVDPFVILHKRRQRIRAGERIRPPTLAK